MSGLAEYWFYYFGFSLVLVLIFARRRPRQGMRLRLGAKTKKNYGEIAAKIKAAEPEVAQERVLNVVFNYNGHSWDAFEVLGLPAGSSVEKVEAAYHESIARVEDGSKPFIEAAYQAILTRY